MKTIQIKALADDFTSACRQHKAWIAEGVVTSAGGSLNSKTGQLKSTESTLTEMGLDLSKEDQAFIRLVLKRVKAGHAFQDAYGIKLAWLGQYAGEQMQLQATLDGVAALDGARVSPSVDVPAPAVETPATESAPSADVPATAPAVHRRNGKPAMA